ncbi:DUF4386 domain-containing protein [Flavobacterium tructae]|uniref:DUF4386 domain-containing protein n=1 Tax=Flavobacterium tructae TaxID=1114873 RepID=A0A1S1J347_9FLAO|nr:DUF4386 domain-containing protein [Flavobacterium tructae]MDL2142501.1 DUF4386 domain-containing protein [Flavobacterium tructae]OHT43964.1 hypothetical protein BHE19_16645 [Flavobacterium tructae]OXB21522.1 hypothetical protein B0A71_03175 [Flavobacterium tructae]
MTTNQKTARIAGLLYLAVVLTGIFSLAYVPSKLIVWDNLATTYHNIKASELLFRLGIIAGLSCYLFFLFLVLQLYKLFEPVDNGCAKVMALLAILSVPIYFLNAQNQFNVLSLLTDNSIGISLEQIKSQVMLNLNQYDNGMRIVHIFSGLWLFPFGYLVYKSRFLPKFFGILLMMGCFGYLINFLGNTLIADYSTLGVSKYISMPATFGEIGICLWLLAIGVKEK